MQWAFSLTCTILKAVICILSTSAGHICWLYHIPSLNWSVTARPYQNAFDDYPTLAKLKKSVEQLPNIAKWLQERPKTNLPTTLEEIYALET